MDKPHAPIDLKKFADAVAACNRCGFCTSYCPTYNATGNEIHSPRGRNQAFRSLIEGKITDPEHIKQSVDTCLLCGECTAVCFSEVPTAELMVQARNFINASAGVPKGLQFLLDFVIPHPRRFYWFLKLAFLGKRLGISTLLKETGLLKRLAPELAAADDLMPSVPVKFLTDHGAARQVQEIVLQEKEHRDVLALHKKEETEKILEHTKKQSARPRSALMPVCGSQYLRPQTGLATIFLLKKLKVDFVIPEIPCCGLPATSYGVLDKVREMAKENIRRFERGRYEAIIIDDSSCAAQVKDYSKVFANDAEWLPRAHAVSQRMREMSSFLLQRGLEALLKKTRWNGGPVAYHDPCKAQYGQKTTEPPRALLSAIPGVKLVPVAEADQCCGGGGTYSFVHPELSQKVLASKVKNIMASGCKAVVTSSASCLVQVAFGLRKAGSDVKVIHLHEFLARVLAGKTNF